MFLKNGEKEKIEKFIYPLTWECIILKKIYSVGDEGWD